MSPPSFSPASQISSTETLTSSSPPTSSAEEEECALSNIQPLPATVSGDELIHSSASAGGEEDSSHHDHSSRANVESTHNTASTWTGFRTVGDNIDRSLRPRHQTLDSCIVCSITLVVMQSWIDVIFLLLMIAISHQFPCLTLM